ncbi:tetratricopeptide repeat protein [Rurimicrobium arvi]
MSRYLNLSLFYFICMLGLTACGGGSKAPQQPVSGVFAVPEIAEVSARIEKDGNNAALYYKRAMLLREQGADSLALTDLKKTVSLDSSKAYYFSSIGELLFEHKDVQGSIKYFKKAIGIDPNDPVSHLKYAKLLMFTDNNQEAFTEINTVLRRNPYSGEAYFLKGMVYKNLKDTNKALSSFQTSIQVDPQYQPSFLQLGAIYASRKDSLALRYFENAYLIDSSQMIGRYSQAMFYQDAGAYEKAKAVYRKIILKDPQYADAFFNMGWILMRQDSFEKAARQFDLVTRIEPANAGAYYNRGVCYELMHRTREALSDYRQAVELDDTYTEAKSGVQRLSSQK